MHITAQPAPLLLVLFDGDCGFCMWICNWLKRLDLNHRLVFKPLQTSEILMQYKIDKARAEQALHVIVFPAETKKNNMFTKDSNTVFSAGGALRTILSVLPFWRALSILWQIPLFPKIADKVYFWIANHRKQLSQILRQLGIIERSCQLQKK